MTKQEIQERIGKPSKQNLSGHIARILWSVKSDDVTVEDAHKDIMTRFSDVVKEVIGEKDKEPEILTSISLARHRNDLRSEQEAKRKELLGD